MPHMPHRNVTDFILPMLPRREYTKHSHAACGCFWFKSMKSLCHPAYLFILLFVALGLQPGVAAEASGKAIPLDQLGAEAQKHYTGDGIGITPTAQGALLRADFQKLAGEATGEGLWLSSTTAAAGRPERFRVLATALGRCAGTAANATASQLLPAIGMVTSTSDAAAFMRPGLLEEYRVSMDGVRQDFVVLQRPEGAGALCVTLAVTGAQVSAADYGVKLTLPRSGREVGYSRLHVTDATGRELTAKLEVLAADRIAVCVEDAAAAYPVRIDPTFSDSDWVSLNPGILGTNGTVYAMAVDGSGNLYVGGTFTMAGSAAASNIAKWDGTVWSALGTGVAGKVAALAVSGTVVYAGGSFTTAGGVAMNYMAKWNGSAWSAMGAGMNNSVSALTVSGGTVYAGGSFTIAGGVSAKYIAQWNGTAWSALGTGMDTIVLALAVMGTDLYAGGQFSTAGGMAVYGIAKWNGTAWSDLGGGLNGTVNALKVSGTKLYLGGNFTTTNERGGPDLFNVATWDGNAWSPLGPGVSFEVVALAVSGTNVYIGGNPASGSVILKWDGNLWTTPGSPALVSSFGQSNVRVFAMVSIGTDLYVGGSFTGAGGKTARNLAKWNGSLWTQLQLGFNGPVYALAVSGPNLYAGGKFTMAGGAIVSNIAKWDGSTWTDLGSGINGSVNALLVNGMDVYAGGLFTQAGDAMVSNIAKWDGAAWSALGSGLDRTSYQSVQSLAMIGTDLYAAGSFTVIGNPSANYLAKWDGNAWTSLGTGLGGTSVSAAALAVIGADLYVGGSFTTAGGVNANNIARWDGSTWSSLGSGVPGHVSALAVSGTRLYAAGNSISVWDGSSWSAIPEGLVPNILTMRASGTNLYVGGAGSSTFRNVAKWDGNSWTGLTVGDPNDILFFGVVPAVTSLALDTSHHLFVGGYGFATFGNGTTSPFLAQANLPTPVADIAVAQSAALSDGAGGVDFGPVVSGSSSAVLTFTLTNPGDAALSGLSLSLDGANAADFAVSTLTATSFVPGDSLTFTVTYTPGALATSSAALHIASNVNGAKNPFDIALTGMGVTPNQGWQQQHFGVITGMGDAAPDADPNHNGIPNLLEYVLGGNPVGAGTGTSMLPEAKVNMGAHLLQLNFKRYLDRNDVTITVQTADDPAGPWTDAAQFAKDNLISVFVPGVFIVETVLENPHSVSVFDNYQTTDPAHPRRFMRLRVSQ
ncbi:MAG: hypothetical protein B7Z37_06375 [Verrucomicrobia bacterium 12-59-8]|nr:MAG: hypothetical protein B7Z37_06375 [Verrucomicrobia bacterium 12-59-8]